MQLSCYSQGSIRENLDPLGLHSDRDMMSLLKDVGLWDILAGLSLSRFKATGQPIPASISYPSSVASSVPTGDTCFNLRSGRDSIRFQVVASQAKVLAGLRSTAAGHLSILTHVCCCLRCDILQRVHGSLHHQVLIVMRKECITPPLTFCARAPMRISA